MKKYLGLFIVLVMAFSVTNIAGAEENASSDASSTSGTSVEVKTSVVPLKPAAVNTTTNLKSGSNNVLSPVRKSINAETRLKAQADLKLKTEAGQAEMKLKREAGQADLKIRSDATEAEVKLRKEAIRAEVELRKEAVKTEVRDKRNELRAAMEVKREAQKVEIEAKREEMKQERETRREEIKQKMEDLREKIKEEKDTVKAKIKEERVEGREKALERFEAAVERMNNLRPGSLGLNIIQTIIKVGIKYRKNNSN